MFGYDPAIIGIIVLAALATCGLGYGIFFSSIEANNKTSSRITRVSSSATEIASVKAARDRVQDASKRRKSVQNSLSEFESQQKAKNKTRLSLKSKLAQAGLQTTPNGFYTISFVAASIAALIGWIFNLPIYIVVGILICVGLGFPRWILSFLIKRRQKKFLIEFPNSLEVIVRAIKSGLPLNDAMRMIAADGKDPVKTEFVRVIESQQLGLSIPESVARMSINMPLQEVNFFSVVISIQAQNGGNLSEVIGNLARVLRERKKMLMKVQALSMEAKASAVILGILPPGVAGLVYVSNPDYIMPLITDPRGNIIVIGAGVWMCIGIGIIKKMISFEV